MIAIFLAKSDIVPLLLFLGVIAVIVVVSKMVNAIKQLGAKLERFGQGGMSRSNRAGPPPLPGQGRPGAGAHRPPTRWRPGDLIAPADSRRRADPSKRRPVPPQIPLAKGVSPKTSKPTPAKLPPAPSLPAVVHHAVAPTIAAAAVRRWLTPETLGSQFILTEVLNRPVALRDEW